MSVPRDDYSTESLDFFLQPDLSLPVDLALEYGWTWDLVWLAIALWLTSLVVDAH